MDRRLVAKVMKAAGVRRWVYVLEFQGEGRSDGDKRGWPHWHVIAEDRVDVRAVRHLWCYTWNIGTHVDAQSVNQSGAVCSYLSGYLSKAVEAPDWVQDGDVRLVSSARGAGILGFDTFVRGYVRRRSVGRPDELRRKRRSVRARLASCGEKCVILRVERDSSGKETRSFVRVVDVPFKVVRRALRRAGIAFRDVRRYRVTRWEPRQERLRVDDDGRMVSEFSDWQMASGVPAGLWGVDVDYGELMAWVGRFFGERDSCRGAVA